MFLFVYLFVLRDQELISGPAVSPRPDSESSEQGGGTVCITLSRQQACEFVVSFLGGTKAPDSNIILVYFNCFQRIDFQMFRCGTKLNFLIYF